MLDDPPAVGAGDQDVEVADRLASAAKAPCNHAVTDALEGAQMLEQRLGDLLREG